MADRYLNWTPSTLDAAFYMDADYDVVALRVKSDNPPSKDDLIVNVLKDGATIMESDSTTVDVSDFTNANVEYNTLTSKFTVGELITDD